MNLKWATHVIVLNYVTNSIRNKIIAVILIAVVSAVLISSMTAAWRQADRQFSAKQNEIEAIAAAIATTIAEPVANGKTREIAATLNAISRIPSVTSAAAYAPDGALLIQHGSGIILQTGDTNVRPGNRIGPLSILHLATFSTETPIIFAGKRVGRLLLIADLSSLQKALIESLVMSLAFGAIAAAIGIAAALYLQRMITQPIVALTQTMQLVRDTGNFEHQAKRHSRDETGLMVDTFNDMLAHIRERDLALKTHRDQLEVTIDERTSDLREAVAIATKANAAKSEFLATMSHEIRTPMNGMLVMAELLSANNLAPRLQRYADVIVKSGHGLLAIINDILDFSKIEAGKLELENIPVDPRRLVDDTLQLFSERATTANLELAAYVAPDVPARVLADPVRLGQVLTNFVNNALKFTETGGVTVRIDIISNGHAPDGPVQLRFSVRDTGIGIPADKITTIFDAFAQADQSTTRKFGGTGIGLSICKRLIGAMQGELSVESEIGEGSTFSFVVPLAVDTPAQSIPSPATPRTAFIDLSQNLSRDALVWALNDWGFTVTSDRSTADVIFGDVKQLSDGSSTNDGTPGSSAPVIALGRFGDTQSDRLINTGKATLVLDRPISTTDLQTLLETASRDPAGLFAQAAAEKAQSQHQDIISFAGTRVLAADDSPINREVLAEVLARLNVEATFVEDGAAAVQAMREGQFDLVFMDGSMPVLDGFEASRQIRDHEHELHRTPVPIVALTAHVAGDKGAQWRNAGMSDFVSKPFTLAEIEACLARWLTPDLDTIDHDTTAHKPMWEVASPAPYEASTELLDRGVLDVLRDIQSADDNLVARVVALYLEHAPAALKGIIELDEQAGHIAIADAAHALKSLSRNIGAIRVGDIADHIENSARANERLPDQNQLDQLTTALEETMVSLRALDDLKQAA